MTARLAEDDGVPLGCRGATVLPGPDLTVTAGLTQPYNSGPVEGTVNKIKARKTQLFLRANHDLLRKLVLLT